MTEQKNHKTAEQSPEAETKTIDWMQIISALWQEKKFIGIITGVVTVLAIIISLILPESFKSTAVLLPDDKTRVSSLGGLSDLAAMAGVSTGGEGSLVKLYPTIIKSESVLKNVIYTKYKTKKFTDSVDLIQYWEIEGKTPGLVYETGLKGLQEGLLVSSDIKLNIVTMVIETQEPQLSADILNTVIKELNRFILTKRTTNASEQRKWIEKRLEEVKGDLTKSENDLKGFREKNRIVTTSPQLLLEQERLLREVQINSMMYIELKKQFELVKIEELKSVPIINVLDYGRAAARKDKPKRSIIVLTLFFLALIGSAGYVVTMKLYGEKITELKRNMIQLVRKE